jgi:hypothetical protein
LSAVHFWRTFWLFSMAVSKLRLCNTGMGYWIICGKPGTLEFTKGWSYFLRVRVIFYLSTNLEMLYIKHKKYGNKNFLVRPLSLLSGCQVFQSKCEASYSLPSDWNEIFIRKQILLC